MKLKNLKRTETELGEKLRETITWNSKEMIKRAKTKSTD